MCLERMRDRVPSAAPLGPARLSGFRLSFDKRSVDGSGKCDVRPTGRPIDAVHGVLYAMDPADLPSLDTAEFLGRGYDRCVKRVAQGGDSPRATLYVADPSHVDASLRPYAWYLALVVAGARQHGLPREYVAWLEAIPSMPDPDPHRERRHRAILDRR